MEDDYDMIFKIVIVGDSGVGKTGLLTRYLRNEFTEDSKATVGVEFGGKKLEIKGSKVKAQIWDTAGQERYRSVTNAYYKGAKGAIIVYDITNRFSFDNIERWMKEVKVMGAQDMVLMIVGNKSDVSESRAVETSEGEALAETNGIGFFETSAKKSTNVEKAFSVISELIYDRFSKQLEQSIDDLYLENNLELDSKPKRKCAC